MSDLLLQLEVQKRDILGKKVKALRRQGLTPANIIFKGKPSLAVEIPSGQLVKVLHQSGYTQALELAIGSEKTTVLVTDVTFAPAGDLPEHVVFAEVKRGEKVHASVPLVLNGEAPGVQKGLMVLQMLDHLEVISPALKIPEQFEIDITGLEEDGDTIRVSEIGLPAEIETEMDPQSPIVKLEVPRAQVAAQAEAEAEEAAAEMADGETEETAADDEQSKEATEERG